MSIKWFDGLGDINRFDILRRLKINQDGNLEVDGQPQVGGGNGEMAFAVKEYWTGSANITKTFSSSMYGFDITNDGSSDLTFTINGMTITVKTGEVFSDIFEAFTSVTITTTVPYRACVKESLSGTVSPSPSPSNDTTPPNPVTNLVAGTVTTTSIPVTWTLSTSTDVANYEVSYSTDGNNFTVASNAINSSSTSYTVSGLTSNTNYTIRVVAIDTSGNRSTSVTVTTKTAVPADSTPPNDVTNLVTSNVTDTSLTLTWTASTSTDIASYDVYNGASLLGNTTSTTYNITGLTASTSYTFKVVSKDTSGNVSTGVTLSQSTIATPVTDTTPPTVTVSPSVGTYNYDLSVTLTGTDDSGGTVSIYYTTNGTTPTQGSTLYTSPIAISATTTLKYIGVDTSGNQSSVQTAIYTIDKTAPTITASPASGATFTTATQDVTLSSNESGTIIYYTLDGIDPTTSSNVYSAPISLSTTTTIKYFGVDTAGNASVIQTANYTKYSVVASDTFNRVDGAVGTAETGQTWTDKQNASNVWNIVNNQLQFTTRVADGRLCVDSGVSDNFTIEAMMMGPITSISSRLIIRDNGSAYIIVQSGGAMAQNSGWVTITASTGSFPSFATGDKISVKVLGNNYTIYQNGVQRATFTYALPNNTVTFHGIGSGAAGTNFDNFKISQVV